MSTFTGSSAPAGEEGPTLKVADTGTRTIPHKDLIQKRSPSQERVKLTFPEEGHLDVATLNALQDKPFKSV
jgi:hypothetical protein